LVGAREGDPGPVLLTALASEALAKEGVDLDDRGRPLLIGTCRWMRASVAVGCKYPITGQPGYSLRAIDWQLPAYSREITRESAFSPVPPRDARKLNLTMDELSLLIPIGQAITPPAGRNRAETRTTRVPSRAMVRVVVLVLIHATLVAETGWKSGSEPSK
jgi:hypothetical protein